MEVTISLDPEDYRLLKKQAEEKDLSVSILIRRKVLDFLKEEQAMVERSKKDKS